jgi:hypothetical protein
MGNKAIIIKAIIIKAIIIKAIIIKAIIIKAIIIITIIIITIIIITIIIITIIIITIIIITIIIITIIIIITSTKIEVSLTGDEFIIKRYMKGTAETPRVESSSVRENSQLLDELVDQDLNKSRKPKIRDTETLDDRNLSSNESRRLSRESVNSNSNILLTMVLAIKHNIIIKEKIAD